MLGYTPARVMARIPALTRNSPISAYAGHRVLQFSSSSSSSYSDILSLTQKSLTSHTSKQTTQFRKFAFLATIIHSRRELSLQRIRDAHTLLKTWAPPRSRFASLKASYSTTKNNQKKTGDDDDENSSSSSTTTTTPSSPSSLPPPPPPQQQQFTATSSTSPQPPPPSLLQRIPLWFKTNKAAFSSLVQTFGYFTVATYLGVYVFTLGSVYELVVHGIVAGPENPNEWIDKFWLKRMITDKPVEIPPWGIQLATAWIITKFTEPVRLVGTLALVPTLARHVSPRVLQVFGVKLDVLESFIQKGKTQVAAATAKAKAKATSASSGMSRAKK